MTFFDLIPGDNFKTTKLDVILKKIHPVVDEYRNQWVAVSNEGRLYDSEEIKQYDEVMEIK